MFHEWNVILWVVVWYVGLTGFQNLSDLHTSYEIASYSTFKNRSREASSTTAMPGLSL